MILNGDPIINRSCAKTMILIVLILYLRINFEVLRSDCILIFFSLLVVAL